jgi:hypothetical protein
VQTCSVEYRFDVRHPALPLSPGPQGSLL